MISSDTLLTLFWDSTMKVCNDVYEVGHTKYRQQPSTTVKHHQQVDKYHQQHTNTVNLFLNVERTFKFYIFTLYYSK